MTEEAEAKINALTESVGDLIGSALIALDNEERLLLMISLRGLIEGVSEVLGCVALPDVDVDREIARYSEALAP